MLPLIHAAALLMCILYSTVLRLQQDLSPAAHTLIYAAVEDQGLALNLTTPQKELCRYRACTSQHHRRALPRCCTSPISPTGGHHPAAAPGCIAGQVCKAAGALQRCASQET